MIRAVLLALVIGGGLGAAVAACKVEGAAVARDPGPAARPSRDHRKPGDGAASASGGASDRDRLKPVAHDQLCVTRGQVDASDQGVRVTSSTTRAVAPGSSGEMASLRFTYRGETAKTAKLASGTIRHQLGIKLRAANGCNVVYVMWRMEPSPFIEVSVKRNPGMSTHAECGAHGYTKVKPARSSPVPAFAPGDRHVLEAAIDGDTLIAMVDGAVVWEGDLDPGARDLDGPAGFRSDNVEYDAELSTAPGKRTHTPGCHDAADDD